MRIFEKQPLAPYTTFGIGGQARWFTEISSEDAIVEADTWARQRGIPVFVLGGGSNVLVSDAGFAGLVLRLGLKGVEFVDSRDGTARRYRCAAGEEWDAFVERAARENCAGIECLAGIPGTVGGTPVQNVGAYGQEVASAIVSVRGYDLRDRRFMEFAPQECGFGYRRSRFNSTDRGRFIVTSVDFSLTRGGEPTLRYADLKSAFAGEARPSLTEVTAAIRRIRHSKGMVLVDCDPDCRSAGSFFKNPVVSMAQADAIAALSAKALPRFAAGPGVENEGRVKLPAAWLIEQAGFSKGYARGAAGISTRHTLALVNRGGATANDMLALADEIQAKVSEQFGVRLEMEPVMIGFDRLS